jgi:hypothetical protein
MTARLSVVMVAALTYHVRRELDAGQPAGQQPGTATTVALIRRGWLDPRLTVSGHPRDALTLTDAGRNAWADLTGHGLICDYCDQPATIRVIDSGDILCAACAADQYGGRPTPLRMLTTADIQERQA